MVSKLWMVINLLNSIVMGNGSQNFKKSLIKLENNSFKSKCY